MSQTKTIPIFPLDLVLFPRQELPLRIFEPRYKQLIDDCMFGDKMFGVCLIDSEKTIGGWNAPKSIGTLTKITSIKDVELDGMQLHIETLGRNKFKILEIIPPSLELPENYDPYTVEGHKKISDMFENAKDDEKMYIRAKVEMIPEISDDISYEKWQNLVTLWKEKIVSNALPKVIEPTSLDLVLQQYYLLTDTPTVDYVYSLAALGATDPSQLQPILEAETMDDLLQNVEKLFTLK